MSVSRMGQLAKGGKSNVQRTTGTFPALLLIICAAICLFTSQDATLFVHDGVSVAADREGFRDATRKWS